MTAWQATPQSPAYDIQLDLKDGQAPVAGTLFLDWQADNQGCGLEFDAGGVSIREYGTTASRLAGKASWPRAGPADLLIKRRPGRLLIYGGDGLLLSVSRPPVAPAKWGMSRALADGVADYWVQKVGDIALRDDFMR